MTSDYRPSTGLQTIEIRDVSKVFERKGISSTALQGVSLTVEKGDIFGVIGYSGAGKSTLIRLVNRLEKPSGGQVFVEGQPLASLNAEQLRALKKRIGMIFQHFNLLESGTVYHNVAIPLILQKKPQQEIRERVTELLEFVGLGDKAASYPDELSGGQKQRVGIARALASNPSILLCDEPTSALDPQTTQAILQLLKRINAEYQITIMIITHEMAVIQEICNRVAVMEAGRIVEQGTVLNVFGSPQHPTTRSFVQTVIHDRLPQSLKINLGQETKKPRLFKLGFVGAAASAPIVSRLIRQFAEVEVNILFASTSEIQDTTLGSMILQFQGPSRTIDEAACFLHAQGVQIQEVTDSVC
ncbi:methionine ABC transporter ATP-binding protein [Paenibacillus macerans]|uniref:methionine ABC transporter ATP-binding protein n=1 Tax=Paenibacillus macerans TaxID=44252 RepID=UPI00203CF473|nr:ATP-binding cassette domain-containing protein [Paenibacillus macerans]MCM3701258.1 ATP-binding cassette domain-containing protein [Paenibacillus macerans]